MKLQLAFASLLFLAMVAFAGCYTQLGYYASSDFDQKYYRVLEEEKTEDVSEAESEESEQMHADAETSESYYGRRKRSYRRTYTSPYRSDTYWAPYAPYTYYAYPPVLYSPHPWFYGYYAPYYGYYRGYYPYYGYHRGYYPYTNVYRRYNGGSRYAPLSRRTYNKSNLRSENRRSRNSRSVTSPRARSERPQRRNRNKN